MRRLAPLLPLAVWLVALGAGCGDPGNNRIDAAASLRVDPLPTTTSTTAATATTPVPGEVLHAVGEAVVTAGGNTVTLLALDTSTPQRIAAEVETCTANTPAQLRPELFVLELSDGTRTVPVAGGREPALVRRDLPAGDCESGWVTFAFGAAAPTVLEFRGSSVIRWSLA